MKPKSHLHLPGPHTCPSISTMWSLSNRLFPLLHMRNEGSDPTMESTYTNHKHWKMYKKNFFMKIYWIPSQGLLRAHFSQDASAKLRQHLEAARLLIWAATPLGPISLNSRLVGRCRTCILAHETVRRQAYANSPTVGTDQTPTNVWPHPLSWK